MIVSCFGHRNVPLEISEKLKTALIAIMKKYGSITIYVGNHGSFDFCVASVAQELKRLRYPVEYYIVLAYVPTKISEFAYYRNCQTLVPEGIELAHPKQAITKRNYWMVDKAQIVIAYTTKSSGGAVTAVKYAIKRNKEILYLE